MCEKPYINVRNATIKLEEVDFKEVFKDDMEFYQTTKNMLINSLIYEKGSSLTYFLNLEQFYNVALERKYQYVKTAICKKHKKRKH